MNTKSKGNIGEAVALTELIKREVQVSIPYGDNARYDLVAEFQNKLNKIQVKYCSELTENDSVVCKTASSTNHTTNKKYTTYENDVDYFIFYLAPWERICIVPISDIGTRKTLTFRLNRPKNNQSNYWDVEKYDIKNFQFD